LGGTVELELNLNLSGGGGNPDAYYRWPGNDARHDAHGSAPANSLRFGNQRQGVDVAIRTSPAAKAEWSAVETVSNSEAGFEKVYQGSCLLIRWPVALPVGERVTLRASFTADQAPALHEAKQRSKSA
jgi:hypothetical protein